MEIRKGIEDAAQGERVVGLYPPLAPAGQTAWKRRLNLYSGRSLGATALETEQTGRAGHLTTRAQSVSAGVVLGLEIELERQGTQTDLSSAYLVLAPGYGLATSGEDVLIPSVRRIPVGEIPVHGATLSGSVPTLANLQANNALTDIMPIGILWLRPVILPTLGEFDEFDPCDEDELDQAYEDQQLADAALLEYMPLPADFFDGAPPSLGGSSLVAINRWRNRIAYAIFAREMVTVPPHQLPWEGDGVAVGVIGFDTNWTPVFVDRASVVRAGGRPMRRSRLQPTRGSTFLWQARLEQLAEQVADPTLDGVETARIGSMFQFLPPAGILPADALDVTTAQNHFFPAHFGVDAVPIPLEQLDVAFEASAALEPFDTRFTDYVRLLVPVPTHLYEPRLLQQEVIDPLFAETIDRFKTRRDDLRGRRDVVRTIHTAYVTAIQGKAPAYPADPTAGDETATSTPFEPPELEYNTQVTDAGGREIPAYTQLHNDLVARLGATHVDGEGETGLNLNELGLKRYIDRLKQAADAADDNIDLGFLRVQTDIYRVRQLIMGKETAAKLVTSPALAAIIAEEQSSYATREALDGYLKKARDIAVDGNERNISLTNRFSPTLELSQPLDRSNTFTLLNLANENINLAPTFEFIAPKELPPQMIEEQAPVVGAIPNLRDTTIGQRLERSAAVDAKDNTRSTQFEIVNTLGTSPLFEGLEVPVVAQYEGSRVVYENRSIQDLRADPEILFEVNPPGEDEGSYFNAGIDVIDVSVAALRAAEARIKRFREAIALVEGVLQSFQRTLQQITLRLRVLDDDLAEARHDVSVAEALRDEEAARLAEINQRRRQILRDEVKFLAYHRPRSTATLTATPLRALDPGLTPLAVPACLRSVQRIPSELRAMVDLFRDVPIRWLVQMPKLLNRLDRVELLQEVIATGITRAKTPARSRAALFQNSHLGSALGQAIAHTYTAQAQTAAVARLALAEFNPQVLRGQSWKQLRDLTADNASLDDLVEAGHGQSDVAQRALRELNDMAQVAACLYARFGEVRPFLRLRWAETLSQYDEAVNLRNLTNLENWDQVEILERRQMQQLVDWLHNAVEANVPQAVAMINDLIRVCLLLASHAPVNQLLTATVAQPTPLLPGKTVTLNVDLTQVKIGMNVLFYDREDKSKVVAQAVIDDLTSQVAAARVLTTTQPHLQVDKDTAVMVTPAQELARFVSLPSLNLR